MTKEIREARPPNSPPEIIVPPRAASIPPPDTLHGGSERELHAAEIASRGRMNRRKRHDCGLRALGETAMARVRGATAASWPLAHSNPNKTKSPLRSAHSIVPSEKRSQTPGSANQSTHGKSQLLGSMHKSPRSRYLALKASIIAAPSAPAAADHSADMTAPISARPAASRSPAASTLMPVGGKLRQMPAGQLARPCRAGRFRQK